MNRDDFMKLIGDAAGDEHVPVAFLLSNGYACVGYWYLPINRALSGTCVLLNARVIELRGESKAGQPSINDFNEFLEEIVVNFCQQAGGKEAASSRADLYGRSISLAAIPFDQIAVVYPVAHIGALMRRAEQKKIPSRQFLDLNESEIIKLLQTKLW